MTPPRTRTYALAALFALACSSNESEEPEPTLTRAELLDPKTCQECHPAHYDEWSGSMHAYAAEDPVFIAMNARGQRETNGALGSFCVDCHAPLAVSEGYTTDGTNLDEVPSHLKGVTCYFCHNAERVAGTHNNPIELANDVTLRGGIADPHPNPAHRSSYSPLLDSERPESADMCGACHDIVTPSPPAPVAVHLERTYVEWQNTVFPSQGISCGDCHLPGRTEPIAEFDGVTTRRRHLHTFPGVDVALTEFPQREEQRRAVEAALDATLRVELCVQQLPAGGSRIEVLLDNAGAGHNWPSGASQDRRAWVELTAYDGETVLHESGKVEPLELVTEKPDVWLLRDRAFDVQGGEAHMFWDVARVEEATIPGAQALDPSATHRIRTYPPSGVLPSVPSRVALRVRIQPVGLDVLRDLEQTGDLAPSVLDAMPTFDLLPARSIPDAARPWPRELTIEWTQELVANQNYGFVRTDANRLEWRCVSTAPPNRPQR